jgi:two-component system sporulation sensor kinase A
LSKYRDCFNIVIKSTQTQVIPININHFSDDKKKVQLLNSFLTLNTDGIVIVDLEGKVLGVNKKFEELHGWTRDEVIGKLLPMTPEDLKDEVFQLYQRIIQGEEVTGLETLKLRKDGSSFYANITISPVKDEHGEVIAFVGIERDITEKKKAEAELKESEERYRVLVESSPEPIVVYEDYIIVFVNPAALQLIGAESAKEMIGEHVARFLHPDDLAILPEQLRQLFTEQTASEIVEKRLIRLDGEIISVEVKAVPIKFQGKLSVQLLFRDVTYRKKTEEIIRRSEKLSVMGQLAAGVAHEIRNPLTALKGFLQLLKEKQVNYVDIMMAEVDRINYIVNEFMSIAKPHPLTFVDSDLKPLIENVIDFMQPQALLFNVQMRLDLDSDHFVIQCAPNRIKQVLMNVLKNAIESMPHGGFVDITVRKKSNGNIVIQVTDQGAGIPQDQLANLGEPFFSLKEHGTGLGLVVCYRIIESHKGEMTIESKINQGTIVSIELPSSAVN